MSFEFFSFMIGSIFVQNLVLNQGFGMSTVIQFSKNRQKLFWLGGSLTFFSVFASALSFTAERVTGFNNIGTGLKSMVFMFITGLIYAAVIFLKHKFFNSFPLTDTELALTCFNSVVAFVPFFNSRAGNSFADSLYFGLFSGIGLIIAVFTVSNGLARLHNSRIHNVFKGAPVTLIYISILLMAFAGFKSF